MKGRILPVLTVVLFLSTAGFISRLAGIDISANAHESPHSAVNQDVPQRPKYYFLDQSHTILARTEHAIESLLTEHDLLSNEQIMIAVIKTRPEKVLNPVEEKEWTARLYADWKIGQRAYDQGILLVLFENTQRVQIKVGYGLEPKLSDIHAYEFINGTILPELKKGHTSKAALKAAYGLLEILESPLIESGKALEILQQDSVAGQVLSSASPNELNDLGEASQSASDETLGQSLGLVLSIGFLGLTLVVFVFYQILVREAHFTSQGWYLIYPWWNNNLKYRLITHLSKLFKRNQTPKLPEQPPAFDPGEAFHGTW